MSLFIIKFLDVDGLDVLKLLSFVNLLLAELNSSIFLLLLHEIGTADSCSTRFQVVHQCHWIYTACGAYMRCTCDWSWYHGPRREKSKILYKWQHIIFGYHASLCTGAGKDNGAFYLCDCAWHLFQEGMSWIFLWFILWKMGRSRPYAFFPVFRNRKLRIIWLCLTETMKQVACLPLW